MATSQRDCTYLCALFTRSDAGSKLINELNGADCHHGLFLTLLILRTGLTDIHTNAATAHYHTSFFTLHTGLGPESPCRGVWCGTDSII